MMEDGSADCFVVLSFAHRLGLILLKKYAMANASSTFYKVRRRTFFYALERDIVHEVLSRSNLAVQGEPEVFMR